MCSYKFYLQMNVYKVGIKATVLEAQNKTTICSNISYLVSTLNHSLVTSPLSHYCAPRWFEANVVDGSLHLVVVAQRTRQWYTDLRASSR